MNNISIRTILPAVIAGIVGTLALDVSGVLLAQPWWGTATMLSNMLGVSMSIGVLVHYANGILIAIILAGLWPLFFGPPWARGIEFMTIQTVFGVFLFMMPLMNMGAFGLEMGIATPIISMIRHWVYGLVVGSILPPLVQLFHNTSASPRENINT